MKITLLLVVLVVCILGTSNGQQWENWGNGLLNQRFAPFESLISPLTINWLSEAWVFNASGDVSTTVTAYGDKIFFPDWAGFVYCLEQETGAVVWKVNVSEVLDLPAGVVSRTSPTVFQNTLILGSQTGAYVFSLNMFTGALIWKTQLSTFIWAIVTQSPTIYEGKIYIGTASSEEDDSVFVPGYECCVFQGEFFRLDATTGHIDWKTLMLPYNGGVAGGYSGAAIWGSSPVIDVKRGTVIIATGNNYNVPASAVACEVARNSAPNPSAEPSCIIPENRMDSIVTMDLETGAVIWSVALSGWDAWSLSCGVAAAGIPPFNNGQCPTVPGDDYDFGQAPAMIPNTLVKTRDGKFPVKLVDLLVVGQKSGVLWGVDAADGKIYWSNQVCPGGAFGGMMWGTATDLVNAYVSCANANLVNFTLGGSSSLAGQGIYGGIFAGISLKDGSTIWETADPSGAPAFNELGRPLGPVTVANGIVYGSSIDVTGSFYFIRASDGAILKTVQSGGSSIAGPTIINGRVFWGSGYANAGFVGNKKLYAFELKFKKRTLVRS